MRVRIGEVRSNAFDDLSFSGARRPSQDDVVAGAKCGLNLLDNRPTTVTGEVEPVKEFFSRECPGKRFLVVNWGVL